MILFIIMWIATIITFLLGYYIGNKGSQIHEDILGSVKNLKKIIDKKNIPSGVVRRPSAQKLHIMNEPAKIREGKNAMKDVLDEIPELREARERLK